MSRAKSISIPDESVVNKIWQIRDQRVMLDRDLADLYGVKTTRLREQVRRKFGRFPGNFLLHLTEEEVDNMVSQNAIPSKQVLGGAHPYAFTEHGILMLSNILKTERALKMSIGIIEVFVRLRETVLLHKDVSSLVEQVERKLGNKMRK